MDKNKKAAHCNGQPETKYSYDATIPLTEKMNKINRNAEWILLLLVGGLITIVDFIISTL